MGEAGGAKLEAKVLAQVNRDDSVLFQEFKHFTGVVDYEKRCVGGRTANSWREAIDRVAKSQTSQIGEPVSEENARTVLEARK